MERGDVEDDAIVEIRLQMQVRRTTQLVLEVPQFGEEVFLSFHVLGKPLGFLTRFTRCGHLAAKSFEAAGFQANADAYDRNGQLITADGTNHTESSIAFVAKKSISVK